MASLLRPGELYEDRYEVLSLIGSGPTSESYLAIETPGDHEVTLRLLKFDPAARADPNLEGELRRRFVEQARVSSKLRCAQTARLIGHGVDAANNLYLVYEYVEGESLRATLATGPLSVSRAMSILMQVLQSLTEAQTHGVLHLDLNPSNIVLYDSYNERDRVKVIGYGMARILADVGVPLADPRLNVGKVEYMSPERLSGAVCTPGSDIYSLGIIVYEMLVGTTPFAALDNARIVARQMSPAPELLPSEVDVPRALREFVDDLLEKDPNRRIQSGEQARMILARVMANRSQEDVRSSVEEMLAAADGGVLDDWGHADQTADSTRQSPKPEADSHTPEPQNYTPHPGIDLVDRELRPTPFTVKQVPSLAAIQEAAKARGLELPFGDDEDVSLSEPTGPMSVGTATLKRQDLAARAGDFEPTKNVYGEDPTTQFEEEDTLGYLFGEDDDEEETSAVVGVVEKRTTRLPRLDEDGDATSRGGEANDEHHVTSQMPRVIERRPSRPMAAAATSRPTGIVLGRKGTLPLAPVTRSPDPFDEVVTQDVGPLADLIRQSAVDLVARGRGHSVHEDPTVAGEIPPEILSQDDAEEDVDIDMDEEIAVDVDLAFEDLDPSQPLGALDDPGVTTPRGVYFPESLSDDSLFEFSMEGPFSEDEDRTSTQPMDRVSSQDDHPTQTSMRADTVHDVEAPSALPENSTEGGASRWVLVAFVVLALGAGGGGLTAFFAIDALTSDGDEEKATTVLTDKELAALTKPGDTRSDGTSAGAEDEGKKKDNELSDPDLAILAADDEDEDEADGEGADGEAEAEPGGDDTTAAQAAEESEEDGVVGDDDDAVAEQEDEGEPDKGDDDAEGLPEREEVTASAGSVTIHTDPPKARLTVNGKRMGEAPIVLRPDDIRRYPARIVAELDGRREKRSLDRGLTGALLIQFSDTPKREGTNRAKRKNGDKPKAKTPAPSPTPAAPPPKKREKKKKGGGLRVLD